MPRTPPPPKPPPRTAAGPARHTSNPNQGWFRRTPRCDAPDARRNPMAHPGTARTRMPHFGADPPPASGQPEGRSSARRPEILFECSRYRNPEVSHTPPTQTRPDHRPSTVWGNAATPHPCGPTTDQTHLRSQDRRSAPPHTCSGYTEYKQLSASPSSDGSADDSAITRRHRTSHHLPRLRTAPRPEVLLQPRGAPFQQRITSRFSAKVSVSPFQRDGDERVAFMIRLTGGCSRWPTNC